MIGYCCNMRQRMIVGIVGVNQQVPEPVEIVDFVVSFTNQLGGTTIGFKFCPWCGKPINYATDPHRETSPPITTEE